MSVGSQRNVIKDLKDAFQAKDPEFHFGIYYSLFEWFNPLYLKDKNGNFQTRYANGSSVFQVSYLSNLFFEFDWNSVWNLNDFLMNRKSRYHQLFYKNCF